MKNTKIFFKMFVPGKEQVTAQLKGITQLKGLKRMANP